MRSVAGRVAGLFLDHAGDNALRFLSGETSIHQVVGLDVLEGGRGIDTHVHQAAGHDFIEGVGLDEGVDGGLARVVALGLECRAASR